VSSHPPIRLICAQCARPLPVKPALPFYIWLKLNTRRWLLLLTLLVMPLLVLSLAPSLEQNRSTVGPSRLGRLTTGRGLNSWGRQQFEAQRRRQTNTSFSTSR
jgi:hypothetical protein